MTSDEINTVLINQLTCEGSEAAAADIAAHAADITAWVAARRVTLLAALPQMKIDHPPPESVSDADLVERLLNQDLLQRAHEVVFGA